MRELPTHSQLPTCPLVGLLLLALTTAAAGAPRAASVLQPAPQRCRCGLGGVPLQTLFDFQRVHVKAGATATVTLVPSLMDFALAQLDGTLVATAGVCSRPAT